MGLKKRSYNKKEHGVADDIISALATNNHNKLDFKFRQRDYVFTPKQKKLIDIILDPEVKVILIDGAAGTSKSLVSVYCGLTMLKNNSIDKMLYMRSVVESNQKGLGFLKGPQPYHSKVLTDKGWVLMGDIKRGDMVATPDGQFVEVLDTYEQGMKEVFRLKTVDGREVEACNDHIWEIQENKKPGHFSKPRIVNTEYIRNNLTNRFGGFQITLPDPSCIEFPEKNLPVDPYLLGSLLGDGYLGNSISLANIDGDIVQKNKSIIESMGLYFTRIKNTISYNISSNKSYNKVARKVRITDTVNGESREYDNVGTAVIEENKNKNFLDYWANKSGTINGLKYEFVEKEDKFNNPLKEQIHKLGLWGKRAWEKSIPEIYKISSKEQRLELLRGLFDTDGHVSNGYAYFTTTSEILAKDVRDIVYSLGGKAGISKKVAKSGNRTSILGRVINQKRPAYEVSISLSDNPFYCERKSNKFMPKYKNRHKTKIESVVSVGEYQCKCIKIDHPRALYITDNYIVTHNTLEEKMEVWRHVLDSKCEELVEPYDLPKLLASGKLQALPINYIRGASWKNMYVCLDEGQNCDADAFKLILTRLGENSKLVICADSDQSDIKDSGFRKIYNMFDNEESRKMGIVSFSFTEEDIVRSEICKFIVKKFKELTSKFENK
jgi:phosphate starvation-inducible protein PhoH/intein/homing endonuclease